MIVTTIDYKKLQDWRPKRLYCHFRFSVVVAIARGQFSRARRGRKSRTCRWNFDAICCSSTAVTISGFGGHIAISGCRSMLQTLGDIFCEIAVVENPRFAVGIVMIYVGDISTSGLDGHIAISGGPSMSYSFVDTFFEFGVVENFVFFRARITVILTSDSFGCMSLSL